MHAVFCSQRLYACHADSSNAWKTHDKCWRCCKETFAFFSKLNIHHMSFDDVAGHDIGDLIPQLKVRILELLLKMQPKLKVGLIHRISGFTIAQK